MAEKKGIYFSDGAVKALGGDVSSHTANRAIDRYSEIIKRVKIDKILTEAERAAITEMAMGTLYEPAAMIRRALAADWEDTEEELAVKWGVDDATLLQKLMGLDYIQEVAIVEAIERRTLYSQSGVKVDMSRQR